MWRSFFIAIGLYAVILGLECLVIDKAILAGREKAPKSAFGLRSAEPPAREIAPSDWAPWSLLSGGAVTMLYSVTIPNRGKKD